VRALNTWTKVACLPAARLRSLPLQCSDDSPFVGSCRVRMRISRRALVLSVACLWFFALGGQAAASPVTSISWTVTGGSFYVAEVMGTTTPITGGSVVWTPASTIFTPTIMPSQTLAAGNLRITLQGVGASVALTFQSLIGTLTPLYAVLGGPFPIPEPGTFASVNYLASLQSLQKVNVFFLDGTSTLDYHSATLGQEVRSSAAVVPEPSTAALLGLGLLALAWTARAGARELRSRNRAVLATEASVFSITNLAIPTLRRLQEALPRSWRGVVVHRRRGAGGSQVHLRRPIRAQGAETTR
jgi:hypothetical protein